MKKFLAILTVFLAAGLLITCDLGGDYSKAIKTPVGGWTPPTKTIVKEITLTDNFQYGHSYGFAIPFADLGISGHIADDDEYTFEFEFTASRNLEDKLQILLLDPSPPSYHTELSEYYTLDGEDGENEDLIIQAGTEYEQTIVLTANVPGGFDVAVSQLSFSTVGQSNNASCSPKGGSCNWTGDHNDAGSGTKGSVKLTFTKFSFTKTN